MIPHSLRVLPRLAFATIAVAACGSSGPRAETAPAPAGTVTGDELSRRSANESPEKALQGRFPGVDVSQGNDGGLVIRIRGATGFGGNNDPLYVVDGMAITPGPGGSLSGFTAEDIASIKVLKDPASLSMYGSRGANGVILITTKKKANQ